MLISSHMAVKYCIQRLTMNYINLDEKIFYRVAVVKSIKKVTYCETNLFQTLLHCVKYFWN